MSAEPLEQPEGGIGTPTMIRPYADETMYSMMGRGAGDRAAINRQFDG